MKYSFSLCVALLLLLSVQNSSAGTITVHDSTYADSIYLNPDGAYKVAEPQNALGVPDNLFAHFGSAGTGPFLDIMFTSTNGVNALTIQDTSTIYIWGKQDPGVDTSAAQVKFIKINDEGAILYESQKYYITDTLTVIQLYGKDYTYMEFSLTENNEPGDTIPGSKGFFLDAVLLVQDRDSTFIEQSVGRNSRTSASRIVSSYPNPFVSASQQTTVVFKLDRPGDAAIRIYDALGREVGGMGFGMLGAGEHTLPFTASEPQIYFARLYLDGVATGPAFRLVAQ